jgi:hypothetical protein
MIYEKLSEMAAVMGIVLIALAYLAIRGWRSRSAAQSKLIAQLPSGFEPAGDNKVSDLYYVVTTVSGAPLERIIRFGLGNRGKAVANLSEAGLILDRTGEEPLFLDASSIKSANTASATIGKAVERDGLVVVTWTNGTAEFDTYLRVLNQEFRVQLLNAYAISTAKKVG